MQSRSDENSIDTGLLEPFDLIAVANSTSSHHLQMREFTMDACTKLSGSRPFLATDIRQIEDN
tara:strand:+ start:636 stop:824 length:189 start_codon:yes stop_codon:yes gene_type:complete